LKDDARNMNPTYNKVKSRRKSSRVHSEFSEASLAGVPPISNNVNVNLVKAPSKRFDKEIT
jgi:hypothetical protein